MLTNDGMRRTTLARGNCVAIAMSQPDDAKMIRSIRKMATGRYACSAGMKPTNTRQAPNYIIISQQP
jgi:hypothetical protein